MVADLLRRCGLFLGPDNKLMGANDSNLMGHFEHREFLEINQALLKYLGGSWENPPVSRPGWEEDPALNNFAREAQLLLETFADSSHWGWKEPRTTILLPFWKRLIPNLHFIICIRNPLEVARSIAKRDGLSLSAAAYLWNLYTKAAIRDTANCRRVLTFYENYFDNPREEVNKVVNFCDLKMPTEWSLVEQSISANLRNQATNVSELLDETLIPTEYKLWYLALRAVAHDEAIPGGDERITMDRISIAAEKLLRLMHIFSTEQEVARLQDAIARKDQEWSTRIVHELACKDRRISELKRDNDRLQLFSDAVRETRLYRIYHRFIRPLRGYGANKYP